MTKFRDLPKGARRLIIYYAIGTPGAIGIEVFSAYALRLGYAPIYIGALISLVSLIATLFLPLIGYLADRRISAKYLLMISEGLLGIGLIIIGISGNIFHLLIGRLLLSISFLFNFIFLVYERHLYKEKTEECYVWHWIIPTFAAIFCYALLIITFLFMEKIEILAARILFIVIGSLFPFFIAYIHIFLPDIPTLRERTKFRLEKKFLGIITISLLSSFGFSFIYGLMMASIIIEYFGAGFVAIFALGLIESLSSLSSSSLKYFSKKEYWPILTDISILFLTVYGLSLYIAKIFVSYNYLFIMVFIFYFLFNFLFALWHMGLQPMVMKVVAEEYKGTVFSTISMLRRFLLIPSGFIVGFLIQNFGSFSPALVESLIMIPCLILYIKVRRSFK